jgi:hypothetical protein
MAVDDINNTTPVLPAALQRRIQTFVPLAASLLTTVKDPVAVATAAAQNLTPAQQAALLGNEALQTLSLEPTSPIDPLLADGTTPDLAAILESEGLSPAQQAALAANEIVQAAIEEENQTPSQQAALTVNQALQTLTAPLVQTETTLTLEEEAAIAGQTQAPDAEETTATAGTAAGVTLAATAAAAAPTVTAATAAAAETTAAPQALNPAQQATGQAIPFQNAVAVYEVRNPTPPPPDPAPIRKDIHPPVPIGRVRPIDPLVLRQEWEKRKITKRKEVGHPVETESRPPLAEKVIRDLVRKANEDLAASGVPLHLVLARNEEGFALDVYDCSDNAVCEVTQEVPLDLHNLLITLDNLEHETGIIVNIKT